MQRFSATPQEMLLSTFRHRGLIISLIKREVLGRYRGSALGILWSFFNPLLMLGVYTFVFNVVFQARWRPESDSKAEFALLMFAGLIIFNLFAECVTRAPGLILANANYVKKVVFPLEVLPLVALGSALFHAFVSVVVWLAFYVALYGVPQVSTLLMPVVLLPTVLITAGLTWLLASVGVYLRDVTQVIGILTSAALFLSPIFYPATALPKEYRPWLLLNPLVPAIEASRQVLFAGSVPDMLAYCLYVVVSFGVAWLGFAWFQMTRRGFADVV
jgi:lipopolysaccharide transport system permease protein